MMQKELEKEEPTILLVQIFDRLPLNYQFRSLNVFKKLGQASSSTSPETFLMVDRFMSLHTFIFVLNIVLCILLGLFLLFYSCILVVMVL